MGFKRAGLLSIAAVVALACGSSTTTGGTVAGDTTGVTADQIIIGSWQPESGPFKFYGDFQIPSMKAMVAKINHDGGINGRKLKLVLEDGGCTDSQQAVQAGRTLIQQDQAFLFFSDQCGTTVNAINSTLLAGTKIVNFSITGGSRLSGPAPDLSKTGYTFFFSPDTGTQMLDVLNFANKKGMLTGKKVGFLGGNDTYGADALAGAQAAASKYGYTLVDTERVDETATNVSVEIAKIKASGAQVVLLSCYPPPGGGALSAALQQDYHPIFLADFAPVSYPATLNSLPPAAWANLYQAVTSPIVAGSADQQARAAALQPYADVPLTVTNWAGGNLLNEVVVPYLKRAGKNLTREGFLAGLYKGPVVSETYGTINITGPNINPVVVTGLHIATFDSSKAETITSERYTPEVTVS